MVTTTNAAVTPKATIETTKFSATANSITTQTYQPSVTMMPSPPTPAQMLPTPTPLSTLSKQEAIVKVEHLLVDNGGCRLPCWWGITAGETSWAEAYQFLATFTEVKQWSTKTVVRNGSTLIKANYDVYYQTPERRVGIGFNIRGDEIYLIIAGATRFIISTLLTEYGLPEDIFIHTAASVPEEYPPFILALFYRDLRILAVYNFETKRNGNYLLGCQTDKSSHAQLFLWSVDEIWTDQRIQDVVVGPDPNFPLQRFQDVTAMDIENFYQVFKYPDTDTCVQTLLDKWK
jgi:hypothetical protein